MVEVRAEMTASVWKVMVEVGQTVTDGEDLMILESMKMEIPVSSPAGGTITALNVAEGDQVTEDQVLVSIG